MQSIKTAREYGGPIWVRISGNNQGVPAALQRNTGGMDNRYKQWVLSSPDGELYFTGLTEVAKWLDMAYSGVYAAWYHGCKLRGIYTISKKNV
jgi:hypothetical protein